MWNTVKNNAPEIEYKTMKNKLSIMYKIFSRLLYNRLAPLLHQAQSRDQHAFTPSVRIEDALLCAEMMIEYALEFHMPVWLLSLDLRKAFDSINHRRLFEALGNFKLYFIIMGMIVHLQN